MTRRLTIATLTPGMIAAMRPLDRQDLGIDPPATSPETPKRAIHRRREPNKTESLYRDTHLRGSNARYEALSFRLANGHRYTPDWVEFDGAVFIMHEVKGDYRLQSHRSARLAFDQAAIEWPQFRWVWATKRTKAQGGGFMVEVKGGE